MLYDILKFFLFYFPKYLFTLSLMYNHQFSLSNIYIYTIVFQSYNILLQYPQEVSYLS
jgi:hypothetical protein